MFDLIGDIHGHADELVQLLQTLGYRQAQVPQVAAVGQRRLPIQGRLEPRVNTRQRIDDDVRGSKCDAAARRRGG